MTDQDIAAYERLREVIGSDLRTLLLEGKLPELEKRLLESIWNRQLRTDLVPPPTRDEVLNTYARMRDEIWNLCDNLGMGREGRTDKHQAVLAFIEKLAENANPWRDAPKCGICGGKQVQIRGRYPKTPERLVCPTCTQERLDDIAEMASPNYGQAAKEKIDKSDPEKPAFLRKIMD